MSARTAPNGYTTARDADAGLARREVPTGQQIGKHHDREATAHPQIAASMDAARREAERWHNQIHAARHGYCPAPINKKPFDMYDVHSATIAGAAPLHTASSWLARPTPQRGTSGATTQPPSGQRLACSLPPTRRAGMVTRPMTDRPRNVPSSRFTSATTTQSDRGLDDRVESTNESTVDPGSKTGT